MKLRTPREPTVRFARFHPQSLQLYHCGDEAFCRMSVSGQDATQESVVGR